MQRPAPSPPPDCSPGVAPRLGRSSAARELVARLHRARPSVPPKHTHTRELRWRRQRGGARLFNPRADPLCIWGGAAEVASHRWSDFPTGGLGRAWRAPHTRVTKWRVSSSIRPSPPLPCPTQFHRVEGLSPSWSPAQAREGATIAAPVVGANLPTPS